jgi:hypothetical protein
MYKSVFDNSSCQPRWNGTISPAAKKLRFWVAQRFQRRDNGREMNSGFSP